MGTVTQTLESRGRKFLKFEASLVYRYSQGCKTRPYIKNKPCLPSFFCSGPTYLSTKAKSSSLTTSLGVLSCYSHLIYRQTNPKPIWPSTAPLSDCMPVCRSCLPCCPPIPTGKSLTSSKDHSGAAAVQPTRTGRELHMASFLHPR